MRRFALLFLLGGAAIAACADDAVVAKDQDGGTPDAGSPPEAGVTNPGPDSGNAAATEPLALDSSFGKNGTLISGALSDERIFVSGCDHQSDGKLLLVENTGALLPSQDAQRPGHIVVQRVDATGAVDTSFGQQGHVLLPIPLFGDLVHIQVQPDQKIILMGELSVNTGGVSGFGVKGFMARLMPNGDLDASFGIGGLVELSPGGADFTVTPNGTLRLDYRPAGAEVTRYDTTGKLDPSFKLVVSGGQIQDVAVDSSGAFDFVTSEYGQGIGEISAKAYRASPGGILDSKFLPHLPPQGSGGFEGRSIADVGDGTVLVGGAALSAQLTPDVATIAHYDSTGQLDTSFGSGKGYIEPANRFGSVTFLRRLDDGRIVYAGKFQNTWGVGRLSSTGVEDASYSSLAAVFDKSQPNKFMLAPDTGKVYACGFERRTTSAGEVYDARIDALANDGAPDSTFASTGTVLVHPGVIEASATHLLTHPTDANFGTWVAELSGGNNELTISKLDALGAVTKKITMDSTFESIVRIARSKTDDILVAGMLDAPRSGSGPRNLDIVSIHPATGSIDSAFGTNGSARIELSESSEADLVVDGSGRILISTNDKSIRRFGADGKTDSSFGALGVLTPPFGQYRERLPLAVLPNDGIVVAGSKEPWQIAVARVSSTGTVETTATISSLPLEQQPHVTSVLVQPDGAIIVAGWTWVSLSSTEPPTTFVARFTSELVLDPTFGTNGVITRSLASPRSVVTSGPILIARPAGGFMMATTVVDVFREESRIDRFAANGQPDGARGVVPDVGIFSLALQPDGKALAAGHVWNATGQSSWVARLAQP